MEQLSNLKIAWICHFSNKEIRKRLPLSRMFVLNIFRTLFGKKRIVYSDFAPWISNLIHEFEKFDDVELHIISPYRGLKQFSYEFESNGIFYHFYKPDWSLLLSKIFYRLFKKQQKYRLNRFLVKRFLKKISPDIVNLIGTENPYYSITALDIHDIPLLVSAQTVYTNPSRKRLGGDYDEQKWNIELKIHNKEKYFCCGGRMYHDLILNNNPNAIVFKNFFPFQKPAEVKEVDKEYDFVFFAAGVTKKKGIEDAIDALAQVKKQKSDVTLNIVGSCQPNYKIELNAKIKELNLSENISFHDYFPTHSDMHQHVKKSRFALLPVKLDVISGTIIEAMLLELPVVTYRTSGTPFLNKNGETVLMADIGDVEKLAENMLRLLNHPEIASKLAHQAKNFVEKEFDNNTSAKRLLADYLAIFQHHHYNQPIPVDLLFNINEFPVY